MRTLPTPSEDVDRAGGQREGRGDSKRATIRRKEWGPRKQGESLRRCSGSNLEMVSVQSCWMKEGHVKGYGEDEMEALEGMNKREKLTMQIHLPFTLIAFVFQFLETKYIRFFFFLF